MSMRLGLIHLCKMVWHGLIITWFDKPYKLWYKFSRGKVLGVRNVLVWGNYGLDRNVFWK